MPSAQAPSPAAAAPTAPAGPSGWRQRLRELGPAAPLFVVAMTVPLLGAAALATTTATWLPWFGRDLASALCFVVLGAFAAAAMLLPTHATSLAAGYVFGEWLGAAVAWLVIAVAAAFGYGLLRPLVGERALRALAASPRALRVHRALLGRGLWRTIWVIALLRLSPLLPFSATNLLLAALGVRGAAFVTATILGITPRALGVAWVGAGLTELDWQSGSPRWATVLAIVATVAVLVVLGRIARRALADELGPDDARPGDPARGDPARDDPARDGGAA